MHLEDRYKKIILLVIDGFGVGEMDDVKISRQGDVGSNTALHVLQHGNFDYPGLRKLGLYDLLELENNDTPMIIGKSKLKHFGADSFFGHQEIMGTKPLKPKVEAFSVYIDKIMKVLDLENISYKIINNNPSILLINDCFTIGDNIETDPGQAFNITADLNKMDFSEVLKIAKLIRNVIKVPRLICFGSKETSVDKILECIEIFENKYIGVNAPKSGVYSKSYECVHLGYGVEYEKQCSYLLDKQNINVSLIGKTADVIMTDNGKYMPEVDTKTVMQKVLDENKILSRGLIFANVQETDLAGHAQDVSKFAKKLKIVDKYLLNLLEQLDDDTLLIVMADHGDDPLIGHAQHTREFVPLLFFNNFNKQKTRFDDRDTMADIGQTVYYKLSGKFLEFGKVINVKNTFDLG